MLAKVASPHWGFELANECYREEEYLDCDCFTTGRPELEVEPGLGHRHPSLIH